MELEKNERINALFAFYQPLLTKKQNDYLQLYYADDYSLGEIATEFAVSRQAVYDNIRRTERILESYEHKLHLYAEFEARNEQADLIRDYVQQHYPDDHELQRLVAGMETLEAE
jgi:uncharacterized protein